MGFHALLQGIFSPQGWIPGLPPCRWILSGLSHEGVIGAHKTLSHLLPPGHIHQSPVLSLHTAFPAGLPLTLAVLRLAPTLPPGPVKYSLAFTLLKTQTGGTSLSTLVRQREVSTFWHALLNPYRLSWQMKLFIQSVSNTLAEPTLPKIFSKSSSLMPMQVASSSRQMDQSGDC